jgi:inorganic pyrophosphatase
VGVLKMEDEAGDDSKLLAVPVEKLWPAYREIETPRDLPEMTLALITHFFEHYKDLERGKWVKIKGWYGPEEAKKEIMVGVDNYNNAKVKPAF